MKKISVLIIWLLITNIIKTPAQNCSQNLEDAKRAYYNGQFAQVWEKLDDCLASLSKEEQVEAYKLLSDTYLIMGNLEISEKYFVELLKTDPGFQVRENDLVEFQNLYDDYQLRKKFSYGILLGFQRPDFIVLKHRSLASETDEPPDYMEHTGLIIGLTGEVSLFQNLCLSGSIQFETASFAQTEEILQYQKVYSYERYRWLSMPLELRYVQPLRNWNLFLGGGFGLKYQLTSRAELDHSPLEPEFKIPFIGFPEETDNYDIRGQRKDFTSYGIISGGVQKSLGLIQLEIRFSYHFGFNNLVDSDRRFSDRVLVDRYAYVPDDFKLNSYQFGLNISKVLSNPERK